MHSTCHALLPQCDPITAPACWHGDKRRYTGPEPFLLLWGGKLTGPEFGPNISSSPAQHEHKRTQIGHWCHTRGWKNPTCQPDPSPPLALSAQGQERMPCPQGCTGAVPAQHHMLAEPCAALDSRPGLRRGSKPQHHSPAARSKHWGHWWQDWDVRAP